MPVLPTVKLRNRRTGEKRIMNQTEYARDMGRWSKDWVVISWRRGDATDDEVIEAQVADNLERTRRADPAREARFHDQQRTFEAQRVTHEIQTEAPAPVEPKTEAEKALYGLPASKQEALKQAAEKFPQLLWEWQRLRAYVRNLTGWNPVSREHAQTILELHENQPKEK